MRAAAFRPAEQGGVLRASWRQRRMRIPYARPPIQPRQKALAQMHLTLPDVVRDMTGVTGMAILQALLAGNRAPVRRAPLRDRRCQPSEEQMAKAWQGTWRAAPLLA